MNGFRGEIVLVVIVLVSAAGISHLFFFSCRLTLTHQTVGFSGLRAFGLTHKLWVSIIVVILSLVYPVTIIVSNLLAPRAYFTVIVLTTMINIGQHPGGYNIP